MLRTSVYSMRPATHLGEAVTARVLADRWLGWSRRLAATFRQWRQRARSRQALALLTDHQLRDIGLSRYDVSVETDKPFWRP